ncbi:hypothetical protein [Sinomicrobium oceani]|uniref:hypothetical protein n=1 Tax=Sinomicrobium oceani TaxID=1150368 RepID=UPI001C311EEC|nr:hypothetical protein [Sinomicrobium oceani]
MKTMKVGKKRIWNMKFPAFSKLKKKRVVPRCGTVAKYKNYSLFSLLLYFRLEKAQHKKTLDLAEYPCSRIEEMIF